MALSKNDVLYLQGRLTKLKQQKSLKEKLTKSDQRTIEINQINVQINNVKDWLKGKN